MREKDIELHKADAKVRKWKLKVSWFQGVPVSSPKSSPNKSGLDSDLDFLHQCRQQNAALEDQLQAANTELGKSHDVIRNLKQDVSWFKSTKCPVCERKTGQTEGDEANKQELVAELKVCHHHQLACTCHTPIALITQHTQDSEHTQQVPTVVCFNMRHQSAAAVLEWHVTMRRSGNCSLRD